MSPRDADLQLTLVVDGERRSEPVAPGALLVEALRESFGAQAPKVGCATGDCGACTVIRDGEPVKSCLELAAACEGAQITTLEGFAEGEELSPVQRAFWDEGAFQCGFCLSGMVAAAEDLLRRNPDPSDEEIRWALSGNLCRCTGYEPIVAAVRAAADGARQSQ
ncbi:MAG: (2Fe-2S)-binding protein [Solirubrobacterales bacterium]